MTAYLPKKNLDEPSTAGLEGLCDPLKSSSGLVHVLREEKTLLHQKKNEL